MKQQKTKLFPTVDMDEKNTKKYKEIRSNHLLSG